jgi:hypothetical protein
VHGRNLPRTRLSAPCCRDRPPTRKQASSPDGVIHRTVRAETQAER